MVVVVVERGVPRVGRHLFYILKNTQFACSQISILYLNNGVLNNIPNRRVAKKENWVFRVLEGSNRTFWRKNECIKFFKFYKNLLNTWKRTTGKNCITCMVQRVKKVKLSWVDNKLGKGKGARQFLCFFKFGGSI